MQTALFGSIDRKRPSSNPQVLQKFEDGGRRSRKSQQVSRITEATEAVAHVLSAEAPRLSVLELQLVISSGASAPLCFFARGPAQPSKRRGR
jgi:hypothetical protein